MYGIWPVQPAILCGRPIAQHLIRSAASPTRFDLIHGRRESIPRISGGFDLAATQSVLPSASRTHGGTFRCWVLRLLPPYQAKQSLLRPQAIERRPSFSLLRMQWVSFTQRERQGQADSVTSKAMAQVDCGWIRLRHGEVRAKGILLYSIICFNFICV